MVEEEHMKRKGTIIKTGRKSWEDRGIRKSKIFFFTRQTLPKFIFQLRSSGLLHCNSSPLYLQISPAMPKILFSGTCSNFLIHVVVPLSRLDFWDQVRKAKEQPMQSSASVRVAKIIIFRKKNSSGGNVPVENNW